MAKTSQVMEKGSKPGQLTFSCWGKGWGEGIVRHRHVHTLYLKWRTIIKKKNKVDDQQGPTI